MAGPQFRPTVAASRRMVAMALDRQITRLAKILVDSEKISFDEAQAKLRASTLEIVVGSEAMSPAAHAAILTAVLVASRTFVGGVRVTGAIDGCLNSALPSSAGSLAEAASLVGSSEFDGAVSHKILVGMSGIPTEFWSVSPWWNGWRAGIDKSGEVRWDAGDNPLPGIAAGALAVGAAFEAKRNRSVDCQRQIDLWPVDAGQKAPHFKDVFLPGALWLIGLGNLGQAFLWTLSALPFRDPRDITLVLQDRDTVTEENWATSVLVREETYGSLKTKVAEQWASEKGFEVRRIDRRLFASDRLENTDPRFALSGVDRVEARKLMAEVGFDCIVDAGLGRTAFDFDRYRVTVFDRIRPIDKHFAGQDDTLVGQEFSTNEAYRRLEAEIGPCGIAEIGGASVAVPYVSALAASVAISRVIAITSGLKCPANEVGRLSLVADRKLAPLIEIKSRGILSSGNPALKACNQTP